MPLDYCAGQLLIEATGRVVIELDGTIASLAEVLNEKQVFASDMAGLTVKGSQGILLSGIRPGGTQVTVGGLSSQQLTADYCLIGTAEVSRVKKVGNFRNLSLNLSSLEAWLGAGSIKLSVTKRKVAASSPRRTRLQYKLDDGSKIEIESLLKYIPLFDRRTYSFHFVEHTRLVYTKTLKTLEDAVSNYQKIVDFLGMFVDSDIDLSWPTVSFQSKVSCKVYFQKNKPQPTQIRAVDCWLLFASLKLAFGAIFSAWTKRSAELGPGIYMYVALKRGVTLYSENRFMNLIYGRESLHRSSNLSERSPNLVAKVERILGNIQLTKDKKWLKTYFERTHVDEPALASRISDLFSSLSLPIGKQSLDRFSTRCAKYRNDISHYGTTQDAGGYEQFIDGLFKVTAALEVLYLLKILDLIGIPETLIKWIFDDSFKAFKVKMTLWDVGLIENNPMEAHQV